MIDRIINELEERIKKYERVIKKTKETYLRDGDIFIEYRPFRKEGHYKLMIFYKNYVFIKKYDEDLLK